MKYIMIGLVVVLGASPSTARAFEWADPIIRVQFTPSGAHGIYCAPSGNVLTYWLQVQGIATDSVNGAVSEIVIVDDDLFGPDLQLIHLYAISLNSTDWSFNGGVDTITFDLDFSLTCSTGCAVSGTDVGTSLWARKNSLQRKLIPRSDYEFNYSLPIDGDNSAQLRFKQGVNEDKLPGDTAASFRCISDSSAVPGVALHPRTSCFGLILLVFMAGIWLLLARGAPST